MDCVLCVMVMHVGLCECCVYVWIVGVQMCVYWLFCVVYVCADCVCVRVGSDVP